jgi:hypothetical protein
MKTKSSIARTANPNALAGRFMTACAAKLLPLLLILTLPSVVQASFYYPPYICATNNNGAITIIGYNGSGGVVTVPSSILVNGVSLPVTSIGGNAFGIIGGPSLTSVIIPDSVTNIGAYAFANNFGLTNVTIGNGVTNIGDYAFQNCPSLTAITAGINNPVYSSVAGVLFNQNQTMLILCPGGIGGPYMLPNSVTSIGANAFYGCSRLTDASIPNNVTNIGDYAFAECGFLDYVYFQGNAPNVDSTVFSGDDISYIFYQPWTAGWGQTFDGITTAPWIQFTFTTNNGTITIAGHGSFFCGGVLTIPDTIYGLPVTSIKDHAFYYCRGLTSVTMGTNITSIGDFAFARCFYLTSVTIPKSVTSIGDYAFYWCSSLTNVCIPNSVTNIGDSAFDSCYNLSCVKIGNSVTSLGVSVFSDCFSLSSVTIGSSVTNIETYAFYSCGSLTGVTIPNSVTNIGDMAFEFCYGLTGVYFKGNAPNADSTVFSGDNNATAYYLPRTTGWSDFALLTGLPTVLWNPQAQSDASFGVQTNQFGFNITGSSNLVIVVEVCTNLANPAWTPIGTNTLDTFIGTNGTSYFSDPQWTNYPGRFYRLRSP